MDQPTNQKRKKKEEKKKKNASNSPAERCYAFRMEQRRTMEHASHSHLCVILGQPEGDSEVDGSAGNAWKAIVLLSPTSTSFDIQSKTYRDSRRMTVGTLGESTIGLKAPAAFSVSSRLRGPSGKCFSLTMSFVKRRDTSFPLSIKF